MLTAFNRALGTKQGRIKPAHAIPFSGEYVFCLGHDDPGHTDDIAPGDFALVEQHATFEAGTKLLRLKASVRPPKEVPPGHKWVLELLVNDKLAVAADLVPGMRQRRRSFALNVSKLDHAKKHFVTARLRFVAIGQAQFISLASFEIGPPVEQDVGFPSYPGNIGTGTLFGTTRLIRYLFPGAIATLEAMGTISKINRTIPLSGAGIATAGAIGSAGLFQTKFVNVTPSIGTGYVSGTAALSLRRVTPTGLSTGYVSGVIAKINRGLPLTGIASAYVSGTQTVIKKLQFITGTGVASSYASGSATVVSYINPAYDTLTGWWKDFAGATYNGSSGSHWAGSTSAGASGGRNIESSPNTGGLSAPSIGSQDGHGTAVFDGTNSWLDNGVTPIAASSLISTTAFTVLMLIKTPASLPAAGANARNEKQLLQFGNGQFGISMSSSGFRAYTLNTAQSAWFETAQVACSASTPYLVAVTFDSSTALRISLNGGAQTSVGSVNSIGGTMATPPGYMEIGRDSINGQGKTAFTLLELIIAQSTFSTTKISDYYSYFKCKRFPTLGLP